MRALLLIVPVALLIWLATFSFPPSASTRGAEAPGAPMPENDVLTALPPVAAEPGAAREPNQAPAPIRARDASEIQTAACLIHRSAAELEKLLGEVSGIPEPRRRCLQAFAWVMAGETGRGKQYAQGLEASSDLGAAELLALKLALGEGQGAAVSASAEPEPPVLRAMYMGMEARNARSALARGEYRAAAEGLSSVLCDEIEAPWPSAHDAIGRWVEDLRIAQRSYRWNPDGGWRAEEFVVQAGEGLSHVRKRIVELHPDWKICTGLLERCNRLQPVIRVGQRLRVPVEPMSVVVDLDARWLLIKFGKEIAEAFEVAVGKPGQETVVGAYSVGELQENPMWFPPGKPPVPYGDPLNPLGTRWIGWLPIQGGKTGLGFHGTNEPGAIGTAASDGCVRLRNEDVEELYRLLPRGCSILVQP